MKNKNSPSEIIITNKKKKMLNSYLISFLEHNLVHFYYRKPRDIIIPKVDYFKKYMEERLVFLKNINCNYYIKEINGIWYSIIFKYNDFEIEEETDLFKFPENQGTVEVVLKGFEKEHR